MTNQRTCFIAAEHSPERSQLRRQLEDRNVTCFSLDRISTSPAPSVSVQSLIQRSDFVAGILAVHPSPNVTFELGLAQGLGKPLLLFADEPPSVPSDLASVNLLPVSSIGSPTWSNYVDAFLRTIHPAKGVSAKPTQVHASRRWREILNAYTGLIANRGRTFEADLEKLVERAFKQGGFLLSRSPTPDYGADFALAAPKLSEAFSLPILIEVKNNSRPNLAQDAINRLSMLIQNGHGGAGLVVTTQPDKATPYLKGAQPIVVVPATELFDWLRRGTFEREFLDTVDAFWKRET